MPRRQRIVNAAGFRRLDILGMSSRAVGFRIVNVNEVCDSMDVYQTQKTNDSS
jgi:hypothetical protein